jgi:hypothetical protein
VSRSAVRSCHSSGVHPQTSVNCKDGDLVVVHATMSGHQTGPFVAYGPDGAITAVFPPLGRRFATTQTHWFRMRDGKVAEHWANRDDLGMGQQLGWTPPTPSYIARMLLARRRMRRATAAAQTPLPCTAFE